MAETTREIERKYEADPGTTLPDLVTISGVAAVSEPETTSLRATYFDTADLRLAARGITLRRRTGGMDAGWHLKLPVAADARDEVTLPLTKPASVVPDELAERVRVYARGMALAPVAQIYTHRTGRQLADASGDVLAELVSDRVSARTLDEAPAVAKWSEIEIELARGDRKLLMRIDRALLAAGLRPAGSASKLANLLGDRLPAHTDGQPVDGKSTASEVLGGYLQTQVQRLMAYDPLVRDDAEDAVHQMRVSTRRLRSALDQFATVLDRAATRQISAELRWLASVLGAVRDREVLRARLTDRLGAIPDERGRAAVAERVTSTLGQEYGDARAQLIAELDGARYFLLLDALDALIADPPYTAAATRKGTAELANVVRGSWKKLDPRAQKIGEQTPDVEVHAARKAAKRFRYAVEVVRPAYGDAARKTAAATAHVQDLLGAFQDSVVTREVLWKLADEARAAGEDTFGYGLLYGLEAASARQCVRDFPSAWQQAARRRNVAWFAR